MKKWTAEELTRAIRKATDLEELLHMVGPTDEENDEAQRRLDRIDEIWTRCEKQYGSDKTLWPPSDQDAHDRLMREQTVFENKYC